MDKLIPPPKAPHAPGGVRAAAKRRVGGSLRYLRVLGVAVTLVIVVASCTSGSPDPSSSGLSTATTQVPLTGIHKIRHVVMIMQENRSFDSYFGTFPGANGIAMVNGEPTVCLANPDTGGCDKPVHDPQDVNGGGPHGEKNFKADLNGGKMDGFVSQAIAGSRGLVCMANPANPACTNSATSASSVTSDVMGWHDAREIPNYWTYAKEFVLHDAMFEPVGSWSLPVSLFKVSGWSAVCETPNDAASCKANIEPAQPPDFHPFSPELPRGPTPSYAWIDLTYLLHKNGVSWGYYVTPGTQPDCARDDAVACKSPAGQNAGTPGIWNPLPWFTTVRENKQLANIEATSVFVDKARGGKLPAVSWVVPDQKVSEPPPGKLSDGQAYVTELINAVMQGPDWESTAVFLAWDDWGGFYDHVVPPVIDGMGYGFRVPSLVISPYAKKGYIDHQTLSFDAYLKFVEDDFLAGQRIDPKTDGRPDNRPDVRENNPQLGDLAGDFNFDQKPRAPLVLDPRPKPGPSSIPGR